MDKYQMLDAIIVIVDKLADARGVERCVLLIDLVKRLDALEKGLKEDEDATNARVEMLKSQIKNLTTPPFLNEGEIREGGQTYTIDLTPKEV